MKKRIASGLILVILICGLYVLPALAASTATVVGGWLRLRANPSYSATVIASYKSGTVVTVLSTENGWSRVLTNDYRIGYMDSRYLSAGGVTPTAKPTASPYTPSRNWTTVNRTAYVTSPNGRGVRLRSSPAVNNANVLGLYPVGRTVTELRVSDDGWSYIRIDKKYGYMMSQYLSTGYNPITPPPTPPPKPTESSVIPTSSPTATPTPASQTVDIQSVELSPVNPKVGQRVRLLVTPSNAEYVAVWYTDDGQLLQSNGKYFDVTESQAGKKILIRVIGTGASSGFATTAETQTVPASAAPDSSSSKTEDASSSSSKDSTQSTASTFTSVDSLIQDLQTDTWVSDIENSEATASDFYGDM